MSPSLARLLPIYYRGRAVHRPGVRAFSTDTFRIFESRNPSTSLNSLDAFISARTQPAVRRTSAMLRQDDASLKGDRDFMSRLRQGRLARLREKMRDDNLAAVILFDPMKIRYATDARNMQLFHMRNPVRYLVVSADDGGPVIMFEGDFGHQKLTEELGTITEIRPPVATTSVATMSRQQDKLREWVRDMTSVLRPITSSIGSNRIGLEPRFSGEGTIGLQEAGFDVVDAQRSLELAGCIKTPEELLAIRQGMNVVAEGVNRMRDSLRPGLSENEFWGILHKTLIEEDGEYVETRLMSSGHRTNPWFQECGSKIIENGELVALDTDCVGPFSYYIDFSRTFLCGDAQPTAVQSHLYQQATEQIYHNMSLIRPGREFFDFVKKSWPIPPEYNKNAYHVQTHGVGMTGEYPYIMHPEDLADHQYPGTIEAGMTLCVESYIGDEAGGEGVKLEEHVLVHEDGVEILSCDCPLESIFY